MGGSLYCGWGKIGRLSLVFVLWLPGRSLMLCLHDLIASNCVLPVPTNVSAEGEKSDVIEEDSKHSDPPPTPGDSRNIKANLRRSTSSVNFNNCNNDNSGAMKQPALRNKSVKMKNAKSKIIKILPTKGKSRRHILKRNPTKAPKTMATVTTSEFIFHRNAYWQVGDVVSILDEEDGNIYYAQLQGFYQSENFSKSAIISWLIPGPHSPADGFDPATFVLGPEELQPISMECFEFVCHQPSLKPSTIQQNFSDLDSGYILSSSGQ